MKVTYLLENHDVVVVTHNAFQMTWKASDKQTAVSAAAELNGEGIPAFHYVDRTLQGSEWKIQAVFA